MRQYWKGAEAMEHLRYEILISLGQACKPALNKIAACLIIAATLALALMSALKLLIHHWDWMTDDTGNGE